tara:strand:+ start:52 stop:1023 length:972 start_codon:yes stop_codon:yes gene_type:complete
MREQTHNDLKSSVPNFDATFTAVVPLSKIKYDQHNSQIRSKGHATSKVPSYAETMRTHGPKQFPPVSVKKLPNGDFELMDGNTRALAAEKINGDLFISWYHDQALSPTPTEWEDWQVVFNDHPQSSSNSGDDIKDYLCRQQQSGQMQQKVTFPYAGNEEKYFSDAVDLYRKRLPNSGKAKDWWERAVEKALRGHIGIRYENYTKKALFDMYKSIHKFPGTKVGEISAGEVVFPFTTPNHCNPNVIGSIAAKQMDNPGVKYTLVYCVGVMAGKDDVKLKAERKKIVDWVKKVSAHYGWSISLYFAPQIKSGPNKENLYQLIKAV